MKRGYAIFLVLLIISAVGLVSAYGGTNPSMVGHSIGEIEIPGFISGCVPEYYGVETIYLSECMIDIDGYMARYNNRKMLTWADLDSGSEQPGRMYYIYLEKPQSPMGEPVPHISATPPQKFDAERGGKYHPNRNTWRYVGAFWNNGDGDIKKFHTLGNKNILKVLYDGRISILNGNFHSWKEFDAKAPPYSVIKFNTYLTYTTGSNSYTTAYIRTHGDASSYTIGKTHQYYGAQFQASGEIPCDSQCRLDAYCTGYGKLVIYQTGWVDDR